MEFPDYPEDSAAGQKHADIEALFSQLQEAVSHLRSSAHTRGSYDAARAVERKLSEARVLLNTEYDYSEPTVHV